MMRHVQKRGRALDFIKHHTLAIILSRLDLAFESLRLGEILLMNRWLKQIDEKNSLIPERLTQERALACQSWPEEKKAIPFGQAN